MTERPKLRAVTGPTVCPMCGKPTDPKFRPFCSQRCSRLDLSRWLGERYAIPATRTAADDDDGPPRDKDDDDA